MDNTSKIYEARLGPKGKGHSVGFRRVKHNDDGTNTLVASVRIEETNPVAEVNVEEIARLRESFETKILELFTRDGTPTTITDVLDKGVPPEITEGLLERYDRTRILELANELGIETTFKPEHDDQVQALATYELRKLILKASEGAKYKALLKKRDERVLKEMAAREAEEKDKAEADALARKEAEEIAAAASAAATPEPDEFKELTLMKRTWEQLAKMAEEKGIPIELIEKSQKSDLVHFIRVHENLELLLPEDGPDWRQG